MNSSVTEAVPEPPPLLILVVRKDLHLSPF
jgi:hypothetical protein